MDMFNPYFLDPMEGNNFDMNVKDLNLKMKEADIDLNTKENNEVTDILNDYTGITALPKDPTVTMAYVPFQLNRETYNDMKALEEGTLFPVLNKPFLGGYKR